MCEEKFNIMPEISPVFEKDFTTVLEHSTGQVFTECLQIILKALVYIFIEKTMELSLRHSIPGIQ